MAGPGTKKVAENRKARHDFTIEKTFEVGLELLGSEVKSLRDGRVQLVDAYASVEGRQLFLYKAHIAEYAQGGPFYNHVPTRKRRLLAHRREIATWSLAIQAEGYTLVPLRIYFKKGKAKLELGLARGKTKGDKRATQKRKDSDREMSRARKRDRSD